MCNVHGVRAEFLAIGRAITERPNGAYFLGKADYTKGYRELIDNMKLYRESNGGDGADLPLVDTYGSGKDYSAIVSDIESAGLPITPHGGIDHAHPAVRTQGLSNQPRTSAVL